MIPCLTSLSDELVRDLSDSHATLHFAYDSVTASVSKFICYEYETRLRSKERILRDVDRDACA